MGRKKQRAARELELDTKTARKYLNITEDECAKDYLQTKEPMKIILFFQKKACIIKKDMVNFSKVGRSGSKWESKTLC